MLSSGVRADPLVDNLDDTPLGASVLFTVSPGSQFTTGSEQGTLNSITVSMKKAPDPTSEILLYLYSNAASGTYADGVPGTVLEELSYDSFVDANYTFTSSDFPLAENTSYWVIMDMGGTGTALEWNYSNSFYSPGANQATIQHYIQTSDGSTWNDGGGFYNFEPQMMAVDFSPIPEPASLALIGLASGFGLFIRRQFLI